MEESYGEGVAIHTDPELCVASREAGCEALVGARAGQVLSPESTLNGVPTPSPQAEGHTLRIANVSAVMRSCP
jgi:RNA-directed DNA polymerase